MRCIKMNSSYSKLVENLEYLKLTQMSLHLDKTIDFMNRNELSFTDALIKLTDYEIDMKEINMVRAMVKVAAFPHLKEIKDFDFSFQPSIDKEQILDFETLRFIECNDLILNLKKAQLENRMETRLKHYSKYKLLIIDEIGYLPIDEDDAKLFFQLIDMRYEKKSTIFTTNSNFKSWAEIFQEIGRAHV